jgi:hypothetical protein
MIFFKDSGRETLMDEIRSAEASPTTISIWSKPIDVPTHLLQTPSQPQNIQSTPPQLERTFKVILAGDASVGKSTFIHRICHDDFMPNLSSTIGKNIEFLT